jgi:hypothetical protein
MNHELLNHEDRARLGRREMRSAARTSAQTSHSQPSILNSVAIPLNPTKSHQNGATSEG